MRREKTQMPDGRYIIYYSFDEDEPEMTPHDPTACHSERSEESAFDGNDEDCK